MASVKVVPVPVAYSCKTQVSRISFTHNLLSICPIILECCTKHDSIMLREICVNGYPYSKVHGAKMGPTWVLSATDGPHVGPHEPCY